MRPVGDQAVLLELPSNADVHAAARMARERHGDQLVEVVPGHRTLLLVWPAGGVIPDVSDIREAACASSPMSTDDGAHRQPVGIPMRYDGADIEAVAGTLGMSAEALVRLHSEAGYVVAFTGFAPGFPYLLAERGGEVERLLELPRLDTPRTEVPAGSVAVAAGYCGIYPRSSPGGWNLLGHTDAVLFDPDRERPALLEPGMRVRFEPVLG